MTDLLIEIDAGSPVPPFEQLRARLAELIAAGRLPPGSRLPTVRQLARDLGLAANTVARTYRTLEVQDLIDTRGRHGTFVAAPVTPSAEQRQLLLDRAARDYVTTARALDPDLDDEAIVSAVRSALQGSGRPP